MLPGGWRKWQVVRLRLAVEAGKTQSEEEVYKTRRTHQSALS